MSTICEIEFENNPEKVFYAGQILRGTVNLTLAEEKIVRGIYVLITGKAYCYWKEESNDLNRMGRENYFEEKTYLYGHENGKITYVIYTIPFFHHLQTGSTQEPLCRNHSDDFSLI